MEHLKDYVWMRPPGGGDPEKVLTADINKKMWESYQQCDPPEAAPERKPLPALPPKQGDK